MTTEPGGGGTDTSKLVERVTALVGLATGAAALIYATGAAVYAAALNSRGVPTALSIATSLPREFLIGSGLLFVALPIALAAVVLFLLLAVLKYMEDGGWGHWRERVAAAVVFVGCIGLAVAVQPCSWLAIIGVFAGAALTVVVFTALEIVLANRRRMNESPTHTWLPYLIAVGVLLMAGWGVWIGIARTDLPAALLCTKGGGAYPGFLIGKTDTRVYVGEDPELRVGSEATGNGVVESNGNTRIVYVESGEVAELFVGSAKGTCQLSKEGSEGGKAGIPGVKP